MSRERSQVEMRQLRRLVVSEDDDVSSSCSVSSTSTTTEDAQALTEAERETVAKWCEELGEPEKAKRLRQSDPPVLKEVQKRYVERVAEAVAGMSTDERAYLSELLYP